MPETELAPSDLERRKKVKLRIRGDLETTATFKYAKTDLMREGYDPANTSDVIYFNDPERNAFVRMDQELFERIQTGNIRL